MQQQQPQYQPNIQPMIQSTIPPIKLDAQSFSYTPSQLQPQLQEVGSNLFMINRPTQDYDNIKHIIENQGAEVQLSNNAGEFLILWNSSVQSFICTIFIYLPYEFFIRRCSNSRRNQAVRHGHSAIKYWLESVGFFRSRRFRSITLRKSVERIVSHRCCTGMYIQTFRTSTTRMYIAHIIYAQPKLFKLQ